MKHVGRKHAETKARRWREQEAGEGRQTRGRMRRRQGKGRKTRRRMKRRGGTEPYENEKTRRGERKKERDMG